MMGQVIVVCLQRSVRAGLVLENSLHAAAAAAAASVVAAAASVAAAAASVAAAAASVAAAGITAAGITAAGITAAGAAHHHVPRRIPILAIAKSACVVHPQPKLRAEKAHEGPASCGTTRRREAHEVWVATIEVVKSAAVRVVLAVERHLERHGADCGGRVRAAHGKVGHKMVVSTCSGARSDRPLPVGSGRKPRALEARYDEHAAVAHLKPSLDETNPHVRIASSSAQHGTRRCES